MIWGTLWTAGVVTLKTDRWFAWYPVQMENGQRCWLGYVIRKKKVWCGLKATLYYMEEVA